MEIIMIKEEKEVSEAWNQESSRRRRNGKEQRSKKNKNWTLGNNPGSLEQIGLVIKRLTR